jgi:chromosome segregation ATPase
VLNVLAAILDDLYICDGCDADGVPDLTRSSGQHTEEHHLIRCLAPEKADDKDASPTEQRLTSIEGRLDGVQTQLDDLSGRVKDITGRMGDIPVRMGDLTGRMEDLTGRMGDITGHIGDLNSRISNIEQLLHRLVGTPEGSTA